VALLALGLTVAVWLAARRLPLVPPIVSTAAALLVLVPLFGISPGAYAAGTTLLVALLAPAIVALALPLHRERALLVRRLVPTVGAILIGSASAIAIAVVAARALGLGPGLVAALAPRSATAPVAAAVAGRLGGDPHLATAAAVIGGVLGALGAPLALRLGGQPTIGGTALGVAAHGIGTARATALDPAAGAAAAIAMGLNAFATSVLAPIIVPLLLR
jgi:putative effector of murein hydrolase